MRDLLIRVHDLEVLMRIFINYRGLQGIRNSETWINLFLHWIYQNISLRKAFKKINRIYHNNFCWGDQIERRNEAYKSDIGSAHLFLRPTDHPITKS